MRLHLIQNLLNKLAMIAAITVLSALCLTACGSSGNDGAAFDKHSTGSMDLKYATQFHVDYCDDNVSIISIGEDQKYFFTPDGEIPDWVSDKDLEGVTVIKGIPRNIYLASSSVMDLVDAIGGLGNVSMTSTDADEWTLENIRDLVEDGEIHYVGKYRAPDYEALLEGDVDLTIENTMIYHNPQIKEEIESLGIPVIVEMSSHEAHPLGRLEWIKLYGLLLDKQDEADAFYEESLAKIDSIDSGSMETVPEVAYFSVNSNGAVIAHKPGDYIAKMIEIAGGSYALDGVEPDEENALSTMNMQMEAFYDKAVDADVLIYNSTIQDPLEMVSQLTDKSETFGDFKAVKSGNVWCTNRSTFQKSTGAADIISEMNLIFSGKADDSGMEFFYKLK